MLTENFSSHEDYQLVAIRIFPLDTARMYPVELTVPDGPDFQAKLRLDLESLKELSADPKAYGLALGRALFADNVLGDACRQALAVAQGQGKKLRVRLRLDASDLHALHWERIYYPVNGSWLPLGNHANAPFSRYVPTSSWKPLRPMIEGPLKVLVIIASPANLNCYALEPIADSERKALHTELQQVFSDGSLTYLETGTSQRPTMSQLRQTLANGYHLVHILCHGAITDDGTVLYLEDEDGSTAPITTDELVGLFNDLKEIPSFCFLAACESAMRRDSSTLTPLGPALIQRSGVQAVVAMTGQVGVKTAQLFTIQFYKRLLQHGVVDVAVNEAQARIQDEWDWGVPVLFTRSENGQLFDYYFRDVRRAWFERERALRESIFRKELDGHLNEVTSPLFAHWSSFIKARGWHEELKDRLDKLRESAKELEDRLNKMHGNASKFSGLASRVGSLMQVDTNANYSSILANLGQLLIDPTQAVADLVAHLKKKDSEQLAQTSKGENNLLQDAERLLNDMSYLKKQTDKPSFHRCFLFRGSLGAGKTQFIASLLATSPMQDKTFLLLNLSLSANTPLDKQILDGINRMTDGKVWGSLKEFNAFLKAGQRMRLVIAIDDLQKWLSSWEQLRDLLKVIEFYDNLHAIYWLIALEDTSFDKVTGDKANALWQEYSYRPKKEEHHHFSANGLEPPISIGGWLDLDDLNRSKRVGWDLLQRKLSQKNEDDLQALQALHEKAEVTRYLSSPFIAWILWDLRQELPLSKVVNLNFIEFITRYWKKLSSALDPDSQTSTRVRQCIHLIAKFLVGYDNLSPYRTRLLNGICKAATDLVWQLQNPDLAEAALATLERSPLLKKVDPDSNYALEERTEIRFEPFWEYQLADQLRSSEVWSTVESWFRRPYPKGIKQGVFEFLLLLLDSSINIGNSLGFTKSEDKPIYTEKAKTISSIETHYSFNNSEIRINNLHFIDDLLCLAIDAEMSLTAAMWFAGPKLRPGSQGSLVALAATPRAYANAHDLFAFMYFVNESAPQEPLKVPARLALLQPYYRAIHDASLSDYYFYIVWRHFAKLRDNKDVLACMTHFSGCEVMDITQKLAELTVRTLAHNVHDDMNGLLNIVLEYLRADYKKNKNDDQLRRKVARWERYSYRQWILCEFCRTLVDAKKLDSYDLLAKHQWYKSQELQIDFPASLEMRQEANLALGAWYRNRAWIQEKKFYVELINKLVNSSDPQERERAFFLIRHTESTEGRKGVHVDRIFHPLLRTLFMDPAQEYIVNRYREDFRVNLNDIGQLTLQRHFHSPSPSNYPRNAPSNQNSG